MLGFVIFCVTVTLGTVHANGDFIVLHTPSSVKFQGDEQVDQSLLKEVFSAALGFTIKQRGTWKGITLEDPFSLPEAVVGIAVEGVSSLEPTEGKRFPLNVDEVEETTWQALSGRLEERDNDNTLVRIYLGDGVDALGQSALGELKPTAVDESALQALSLNVEEDRKFLEEIGLLQAIANKIPSAIRADGKPDVYWLVVSGLKPVLDLHGKNSAAAKEALYLLKDTINEVSKAFMDVYDSKVLITAFTNDASQVRHTRSVPLERARRQTEEGKNEDVREQQTEYSSTENNGLTSDDTLINEENIDKESSTENIIKSEDVREQRKELSSSESSPVTSDDVTEEINDKEIPTSSAENVVVKKGGLNLSKDYSENYPVIFNILLWFGVAFFFSLLAICIAIADMDPGRDSIIYRMTSNRMKKDN